jgi:hypothetical protein
MDRERVACLNVNRSIHALGWVSHDHSRQGWGSSDDREASRGKVEGPEEVKNLNLGIVYYQEFTEDISGMDHEDYEGFKEAIISGLQPRIRKDKKK